MTHSVPDGRSNGLARIYIFQNFRILDHNCQSAADAILQFASGANAWNIRQDIATGRLVFLALGGGAATGSFKFDPAGQENLLRVGVTAGDAVDITGRLIINGSEVTPDYVFDPDYQRESIEAHAAFMWENRHLPSLPPAGEDGTRPVDVVSHQYGMLKELEMAHVYIDELNGEVTALRQALAQEMSSRSEEIETLRRELNELRDSP